MNAADVEALERRLQDAVRTHDRGIRTDEGPAWRLLTRCALPLVDRG